MAEHGDISSLPSFQFVSWALFFRSVTQVAASGSERAGKLRDLAPGAQEAFSVTRAL